MSTLVLTARDMDLLAFLALHRECPLDLLAPRFFAKHPYTREAHAVPIKPCLRRLRQLCAHGYVDLAAIKDAPGRASRRVARLARRADDPLHQAAARRAVPAKERLHHLRTLEAVHAIELDVRRRGGRVVEFRLEGAIRAEAQRGRMTRRGESFESFPDAVCTIAYPSPSGERVVRVAVEYVTSKYTDADIYAKHESFPRTYDGALWFADNARTAERVRHITGGACALLR